jgi:hypothetical protein
MGLDLRNLVKLLSMDVNDANKGFGYKMEG